MDNGLAIQTDGAVDDRHDRGDGEMRSPTSPGKSSTHRRSLSNTILGRLSFLRTSQEETRPLSDQLRHDEEDVDEPTEASLTSSQRVFKSRKRKGSLRKTALLVTGKLHVEGGENHTSPLQRRPSITHQTSFEVTSPIEDESQPTEATNVLPRTFSYEHPIAASSSDSSWSTTAALKLPPLNTADANRHAAGALHSPLKSPESQSYASTTDEEETLSFSHPANSAFLGPTLKSNPPTTSSYFPPQPTLARRRSSTKPGLSPLSALPMDAYTPEEEWDYSETEWWGWVVLVVTWIVFVVGMGSCLEVWSYAWDVGQTPYAPPELEDDPTLPIVGYYPALIILSAVMAWVWVVVAWVGMKYFKHAKIQGDDT
ncbi:hypothetical protein MBLNU457_6139t1 [Dothideomycetes sp. NU457]